MKINIPSKILAVVLALLFFIPGCLGGTGPTDIFHGEDITKEVGYSQFMLTDQYNESFESNQLEGRVAVIAFLFTNCPDICPIVSSNLKMIYSELGPDHMENNVTILTITVDPWRDTPDVMNNYSIGRNLTWLHLTSEVDEETSRSIELEKIWGDFEVGLEVIPTSGASARHHGTSYDIDHSTGTIIIDRDGKQRVWWGDNDWAPMLVLEDIKALI